MFGLLQLWTRRAFVRYFIVRPHELFVREWLPTDENEAIRRHTEAHEHLHAAIWRFYYRSRPSGEHECRPPC